MLDMCGAFSVFRMTAGRRVRIALSVFALAFALATSAMARLSGDGGPPSGPDAEPPKVLCFVKITKITDLDGLPLAPMGLIAFEDGVYRLRTEEGREIEIAEKEVSSVAFMPIEKKPRDDKFTMRSERERFIRLKRRGALGHEIKALEKRLAKADTAVEAATQMRRIVIARIVDKGRPPSKAELRRLVGTIEKVGVRERVKHLPDGFFMRLPGGPRRPR